VETALRQYCDFTSIPRKSVIKELAEYATDPEEKIKLHKIFSTDSEYVKFVKQELRGIVDLFIDFPSLKPPLDLLLEIAPKLAPRYYSISSSYKANPGRVHITVASVNYKSGSKRIHSGVASYWLRLPEISKIPVFIRKSSFRLPVNPMSPIIMVGPGTGLAPFRGFIQERQILEKSGENLLFFGCRNRNQDYIYKEELESAASSGLIKFFPAFSREQNSKVYVQHKILEYADAVASVLLTSDAYLYICGDARSMPKDVQDALIQVLIKRGMLQDAAKQLLDKMAADNRFMQDTWF